MRKIILVAAMLSAAVTGVWAGIPAGQSQTEPEMTEQQRRYMEFQLAMERKQAEMQTGDYAAPGFTFLNREGKEVSLSDFKGKWVVIDFWGSWCGWCIKGIPEMKAAYDKYKPQLEIVGVACNDTREAWLRALDKYQLPWVNLYNPTEGGGPLLLDYAVLGFPTKVIVNPEGKIANITSGEDPAFYVTLDRLITGK